MYNDSTVYIVNISGIKTIASGKLLNELDKAIIEYYNNDRNKRTNRESKIL